MCRGRYHPPRGECDLVVRYDDMTPSPFMDPRKYIITKISSKLNVLIKKVTYVNKKSFINSNNTLYFNNVSLANGRIVTTYTRSNTNNTLKAQ